MWKCHKCGKPVYFAERKQSLGYDWHPECLRCEECGKRLNPGQHAEHKGVPYCHVPCYGALFGPQLFGHGTRVESHKSFGQNKFTRANTAGPVLPRSHLETKLKVFNQFNSDGRALEIRSREVNGRLVLEGALRIHWGVRGLIHLKEDDDQRTLVTVRKRNSCRISTNLSGGNDSDSSVNLSSEYEKLNIENKEITINNLDRDIADLSIAQENQLDESVVSSPLVHSQSEPSTPLPKNFNTLPSKLEDIKNMEWDEWDELLQVERKVQDSSKLYQTMPPNFIKSDQQSSNNSPSQQSSPSDSSESPTTPTKSFSESLPPQNGEPNIGTLRRVKNYEQKIEKQNSTESNTSIKSEVITIKRDDTSWIEKGLNRSMSGPDCLERNHKHNDYDSDDADDDLNEKQNTESSEKVQIRHHGSTAIRRRPGARRSRTKLKRRCSINGHFYDRETSIFTPPHGSQMSVWVTSLVNTQEVINLMLEKYKVDSDPDNFALFVVRDNGEQRRLRDEEYPLLVRVLLGPHEDVAKLFIFDRHNTNEVSSEVAQFLNLSQVECRAILQQYRMQEEREIQRILAKFHETKKRIKQRMEDLKVRL